MTVKTLVEWLSSFEAIEPNTVVWVEIIEATPTSRTIRQGTISEVRIEPNGVVIAHSRPRFP